MYFQTVANASSFKIMDSVQVQIPPETNEDDEQQVTHLSANCVLYVSYNGETSQVVDEHFNRALNPSMGTELKGNLLSSRTFPSSFWNSNHQQETSQSMYSPQLYNGTDYTSAAAGALMHLHSQSENYGYFFGNSHSYPRNDATCASSTRFNGAQYNNFLFDSGAGNRFPTLSAPVTEEAHSDMSSWCYSGDVAVASSAVHMADKTNASTAAAHYSSMAGYDSNGQDCSNLHYWS